MFMDPKQCTRILIEQKAWSYYIIFRDDLTMRKKDGNNPLIWTLEHK